MIKEGSKVTLHYTLTVEGRQVESSRGGQPLSYEHGNRQIIPGLEEQLEGLDTGSRASAVVPPEKAYGPRNPEGVHKVPAEAFSDPDKLSVGDVVTGEAGGQPLRATVTRIEEDGVTVDLNHPLAGKTLEFDIEVVSVE